MDKETLRAGLVGIIAFIAIVCELVFGGISATSISAAVKDLMGIMMDVMVFILAIKIATRKKNTESLDDRLESALDKWRMENSNMIVRDEEYDKDKDFFSFFMRTDLKNFFGDAKALKKTGWFVRIPKIGSKEYLQNTFKIQFHLNVSTFLEGKNIENRKVAFETIAGNIATFIQSKCNVTVDKIQITDADATITVLANGLIADVENNISEDDQINKLVSIIDTAYTSYLVAGNFKE